MKKFLTIVTTALIAIAVVSCNSEEKPNNEEVRKLPSRMFVKFHNNPEHHNVVQFTYDEKNRMTRLVRIRTNLETHPEHLYITYNSDNLPIRLDGIVPADIIYQDDNNTVIIHQDTFWLNDKGQIAKHSRSGNRIEFTYNSSGNIITVNGVKIDFEYSNIRSIWRYVNMPEWLHRWLAGRGWVFAEQKYGYFQLLWGNFELDENGYIIKIKNDEGQVMFEFEYIFAN